MQEFLLLFRSTPEGANRPSPEQLKNISKPWQDWMAGIAAQNKLADRGNRLGFEGATISPSGVTDGPYAEIKEIVLGYIMVKTASLEDAIELAKDCPAISIGGSVEVRSIIAMNL